MLSAEVIVVCVEPQGELSAAQHAGQAVLVSAMLLLLVPLESALEGVAAVLGHFGSGAYSSGSGIIFNECEYGEGWACGGRVQAQQVVVVLSIGMT